MSFCGFSLVFCYMFFSLFVAVTTFSCSFFRKFKGVSSAFGEVHTLVTRVNGSCLFSSVLKEFAFESSLVCLFIKLLSLAVAFCCFRRSLNMIFVVPKWGKFFIFFLF